MSDNIESSELGARSSREPRVWKMWSPPWASLLAVQPAPPFCNFSPKSAKKRHVKTKFVTMISTQMALLVLLSAL